MLVALSIRDVVLIERMTLAFPGGLSVLTGETGAGKSILLDALGLALGARADSGLVRSGAERASVTAEFEPPAGHPSAGILDEQGLDAEDRLVLRRVLGADGRSRAFVNDQAVSVGLLRRLGDTLVEIQGQFEQRGLLDPATHRLTLDAFGRVDTALSRTRKAHAAWREAVKAHEAASSELEQWRAEESYLRHAVEEFDALSPTTGEEVELDQLRDLLIHGEQVLDAMNAAETALSGERGAEPSLSAAHRALANVADKAAHRLDPPLEAIDRALAELQEAVNTLGDAASGLDADPARLAEVDDRLHAIRALARKHSVTPDALPERHAKLAEQLARMEDGEAGIDALAEAERAAEAGYREAAETLSQMRAKAAGKLDTAVAGELPPLKMERATFVTVVAPLEDPSDWGPDGFDRVRFEVATNPGTPAGPIHRIASGGELARFLLALKVVLAEANPVATLIFDEVDAGVGGAVAAAVGDRLARLAGELQVLVVTHSPQVAAKGAAHWHVEKSTAAAGNITTIDTLDQTARLEEIARMLSGAQITDEARAAAGSLLERG